MKRALALGLAAVIAVTASGGHCAWAGSRNRDHDHDEDRARAALERGDILPIARILPLVAQYLPGDVIEVKLETRRGRFNYEIKVLTSAGQVRKLILDARTGAAVGIED